MKRVWEKILTEVGYIQKRAYIKPKFVSLITTFRCNFDCRSCSIGKKESFNKELNKEDWLAVAEKLIRSLPEKTFVEINGGEPLLNEDLVLALVQKLKSKFKNVFLNTNGSTINKQAVCNLERVGLNTVKISFYSLDERVHNFLRQSDLSYKKARRAIEIISQSGLNLEVGILITKQNIASIPDLLKWLNYKKITAILQPLDEIVESDLSKRENVFLPKELWPNKKDVGKFFSWLYANIGELRIKNSLSLLKKIEKYYLEPEDLLKYRCFAGQRNLIIYPDGGLSFCFKSGIFGNIAETNIEAQLKSKEAVLKRQYIAKCCKYCRILGCNYSRGFKEYFMN